jgi:glycosyltransferase involved in cell wall biosynthesis
MRVALITPEFPPDYSGGLGVHVASLAKYLRSRGDEVDVYRTDGLIARLRVVLAGGLPRQPAVDGAIESVAREAVREFDVQHGRSPYDILHCHGWEGAALASQLTSRAPVVTTIHLPSTALESYERVSHATSSYGHVFTRGYASPILYESFDSYSYISSAGPTIGYQVQSATLSGQSEFDRVRLHMIARRLEALAVKSATLVLTVSGFTVQELERGYGSMARARLVHNGVDTRQFSGGNSSRLPLVLAVGRYVPQKGFRELPDIFHRVRCSLPNARLRIVGSGPEEQALSADLGRLGLNDVAELRAFVPHREIVKQYRDACVLAMPSAYEPFGLVAIEAMACETPVVAYDVGGLRESITSGDDGSLVGRGDRSAFAAALIELCADPRRARLMGKRARQTVMSRFSLRVFGSRTRKVYGDARTIWDEQGGAAQLAPSTG